MELTMSMFATQADYWKARAELAEKTVEETARELGCENDNEAILLAIAALKASVEQEREACAKVCETLWDLRDDERARMHAGKCAYAIRARGSCAPSEGAK